MNKFKIKSLSLLIVVLTVFSVQPWLNVTVSTTSLSWILNFIIICITYSIKNNINTRNNTSYIKRGDSQIINIYLIWLLLSSIRGGFIADNYWEYKQLIKGFQSSILPLFVFIFSIPNITGFVLKTWLKYALIIFIFLIPFLGKDGYHFYLGPIFIIGCFLPLLSQKWKIIITSLLILMLTADLGARSQVIKSSIVLLIALGIYLKRFIPIKLLKTIHWMCYIIPIILLFLGISGIFNIFKDLSSNKGKYIETKVVDGQVVESDLAADTRTFIYVEVIESAIKHNYVIWGRTPARGNDSATFGAYNAEELKTGKYERHANEVCHPNIFTWLGLIGMSLYSLIYLRSSYLAVYKSNNDYVKYLGCFIAFRWAYGWIEDGNTFAILSISLWMIIAMGISIKFRYMNNREFETWIKKIFN